MARRVGSKLGRNLLIVAGAAVAAVVIGPFVYINFISEDAPPPLTLPATVPTTTPGTTPASTSGPSTPGPSTASGSAATALDGSWTVRSGQAGYRVVEVLFGQDNTAVGRTTTVTGTMTLTGALAGPTVSAATVTVDLASVTSDDNRRDNQFRGRIMNTATFPTATFRLARPVTVASLPADGVETKVTATGELTLRGQTKTVEVELTARRTGSAIDVSGSIPVTFADYGIPNPSVTGITTRDNGIVEFLLNLTKA